MEKIFFIIVIFLISLYMSIGGTANLIVNQLLDHAEIEAVDSIKIDGGRYKNVHSYIAESEYESVRSFFPVYDYFGTTISYIITVMCFGMLGSVVRILNVSVKSELSIRDQPVYVLATLGAIIGLSIVVLSYLLPEFKNDYGKEKVYYAIAFLAGIYSEEFLEWLKKRFKNSLETE